MLNSPVSSRHVSKFLPITALVAVCQAQTLYQFGDPTAEEQSYIELINRARANPPAEGARLAATTTPEILSAYTQFGVNLTMMQSEFNAIAVTQPLAPSGALTTAARNHSLWMLNNATQSHNETGPANTTAQRITNAGYSWSSYGENIYAYSYDVWFGHAGFQVDWGTGGTGGMQNPRGHRNSIHLASFKEIGVGIRNGVNGPVGPQLVTQDFASPQNGQTFGTGVAYYDLNSNNFYDIGEGISGLTVNVTGATKYCITAAGGGWVVPVPNTATTRTVAFTGLNITQNRALVLATSTNAKTDLKLTYAPPAITSPATAIPGNLHTFAFSAVGGATVYKWNRAIPVAAPAENCDSLTGATISTTTAYNVLNTSIKQQGSASFHLANPEIPGNQSVELNTLFLGSGSPSLTFQSRLRYATADERHKVQIREEGSAVWQDVYEQLGTDSDEAAFSLKTINLPTMAGKRFRVRFFLGFSQGGSYSDSGNQFGWFIDAINFTGISALTNSISQTLSGTSGTFTPVAGNYLMSVAPVISGLDFPSADQTLTVANPPPSFATWAAAIELANSLTAGAISNNPNADLDKDSRVNLVEYGFGTSPVISNEPASRMPAILPSASHFVIRYVRDTSLTDLSFVPVAASDLAIWKSPGQPGAPVGFTDTLVSTIGNLETREAKIPLTSGGQWFMRVRVSRP